MTKEGTIKKVLSCLTLLQNEYNVPLLFSFYSKRGIVPFGSEHLVEKFNNLLKNESCEEEDSWAKTFEKDQQAINEGAKYDEEGDAYVQSKGNVLPERLPADIDLMVFTELSPIVTKEILKWYWRQGGKYKAIHYGHPSFKADFWPDSWPWENVKKCFSNIRKKDFTGPKNLNLTEFLRIVLKNILQSLSIDPAKYVSKKFTLTHRRNRQKHRGIHRLPSVEVDGEEDYDYEDEEEVPDAAVNPSLPRHGGNDNDSNDSNDSNYSNDSNESNDDANMHGEGDHIPESIQNTSFHDTNENQETVIELDVDVLNISTVLQDDLMDHIEAEIGQINSAEFFSELSRSPVIRRSRPVIQSPPRQRRRVESPPSIHETLPSTQNPFRIFRKGPSDLNETRIPCNDPRIRIQVSNEASPIQNIGVCETRPRGKRQGNTTRNGSQNPSVGSNDEFQNVTKVKISADIVDAFRNVSEENSAKFKETGGLLAGRMVGDCYILDTIFVPSQVGYSDWFETTDAFETFEFFNANPGLVILGVIHTHPGFESFLSSVDLHMLYNYACLNASVISIVYAPERNTFPAFALTTKGMETLQNCEEEGFHRHK